MTRLRARLDKLTGRHPRTEEPPAPPNPFEPNITVRTQEEQEVVDEKQRKLLEEHGKDKPDPDRYITGPE